MISRTFTSYLLLISLFLILQSCGTTDTVTVVDRSPESAADSTDQEAVLQPQDEFMQLSIGLLEPVTNLDPLFAENLSSLRVMSLIYDGLFELNDNGEPEPKLVTNTEVSEDGIQYLLTINRDLYFHDSNVFSAGVGRRIQAQDVKWAFERTARNGVPHTAAQLLMNVRGFENYYLEQQNVYDPDQRVISGVSGIEVVNNATIRFTLKHPDDQFLHKLASPYLSIYPREAVENRAPGLKNQPVGTGPYILNEKSENAVILARNPSPRFTEQVGSYPINRINFSFFSSESEIFQQFARQNIDWIPEMSPLIQQQVVNTEGEITSSYSGQFQLIEQPAQRLTNVYLNEKSEQNLDAFKYRLNNLERDQLSLSGDIRFQKFETLENEENEVNSVEFYIVFTDNPFARIIFNDLNNSLFGGDSSLTFLDIRTPTPETILYSRSADHIHNEFLGFSEENLWLTAKTTIFGIHHNYVKGLRSNAVPWKLPVENVEVDESDRDDS